MKNAYKVKNRSDLDHLCALIRAFVIKGDYESCFDPIRKAMEQEPHAPQPHNLMGIVLEKSGDHLTAMKHFRAAWALDPTYSPANHNLFTYGTFFSGGRCAFDESDVPIPGEKVVLIPEEEYTPEQPARKRRLEYDRHGIGHAVRS